MNRFTINWIKQEIWMPIIKKNDVLSFVITVGKPIFYCQKIVSMLRLKIKISMLLMENN